MSKKKRLIILLSAVVVIAAAVLTVRYIRHWSTNDPTLLSVSGNIEVRDAEISFKLSGRVLERLVSEGELAEAGQIVARLDDSDLIQEVALRQAELRASLASLAELEAGFRPEEIAQGHAAMQKAQWRLDELLAGSRPQEIAAAAAGAENAAVNVAHLKIEFDRQSKLLKGNTISQREFDRAESEYQRAVASLREAQEKSKLVKEGPRKEQIAQARAALNEARNHYEMLKNGPRKETIEQSRARVEQARASHAMANIRLSYATISAPFSGIILSENVESGEYVSPGTPVVTMGDLKNVWLRAYINETDLGRVKPGQMIRVTTDTYPGKIYEGRISFISSDAEFTPKNVQTEKERVKLVYRVKIDIPNPGMELKPGMPADAEDRARPGSQIMDAIRTENLTKIFNGLYGGGPFDFVGNRRGNFRPRRPGRRGQDDDHAAADRHHGPHGGRGMGVWPSHGSRGGGDQGENRVHEPALWLVSGSDRHGEYRFLCGYLWRAAQGTGRQNRSAVLFQQPDAV